MMSQLIMASERIQRQVCMVFGKSADLVEPFGSLPLDGLSHTVNCTTFNAQTPSALQFHKLLAHISAVLKCKPTVDGLGGRLRL